MGIYGPSNQRIKTIEELAELIQAIAKYNLAYNIICQKKRPSKRDYEDRSVAEGLFLAEIADVEIMLEQMKLMHGRSMVEKWKEFKLRRQDARNNRNRKP